MGWLTGLEPATTGITIRITPLFGWHESELNTYITTTYNNHYSLMFPVFPASTVPQLSRKLVGSQVY